MSKFYVYVLCDPRKPGRYVYPEINATFLYEPFYVGKGSGTRSKRHECPSERTHIYNRIKAGKIKHIQELGFNLSEFTVVVSNNLEEEQAFIQEILFIKNIGRIDLDTGPLSNLCDGGTGTSGKISLTKGKTYEEIYGPLKAAQLKKERSERFKGKKNPMYGVPSYWKNKPLRKEMKEALSDSNSIAINQFDKQGNFIKTWKSSTEAAKHYDIHSTAIGNHLKGRSQSCQGYIWKYKD